ncbi:MAG TPA: hypothetical protein VFT37_10425 [Telluria sp.]|nr:hypothetical protein [Telluria sp.]
MTDTLPAFVVALMVHGAIGGTDVVVNHELLARLPRQPWATTEQYFHTLRELVFAAIFASLAWYEWHGGYAGVIVVLFALELWISTMDTNLEWNTRVLPWTERVMHVALFVNFGIVVALLGGRILEWARAPAGLVLVDYGWASWVLSALAAGSLAWSLRDAISIIRHRREPSP